MTGVEEHDRLAILEGRNEPHGNVRRRRELEARPIQALASLAAFLAGHFAAFLSLTPALPVQPGSSDQAGRWNQEMCPSPRRRK